MAQIKIKNLRLRCIIGIYDFERENKQNVIFNIKLDYNAEKSCCLSDKFEEAIDYHDLCKKIERHVESSQYDLIEKLSHSVLEIIFEDQRVKFAQVEVGKPNALNFADSVSVTVEAKR